VNEQSSSYCLVFGLCGVGSGAIYGVRGQRWREFGWREFGWREFGWREFGWRELGWREFGWH